ncbi:MAG: branched-chain amino acid transaminase [Chloroflexi bacterium]|nr:branched-chain amino acid transaminase [Chloroflexota bacterium]
MTIPATEWIWMNGKFVHWDDAKVHFWTHALHYGSSVFEGIRAYKTVSGTAVFCLDAHLDRLWNSCKVYRMPIPYEKPALKDAVVQTIIRNELESAYIRPLVWRGVDAMGVNAQTCPVEVAISTVPLGRYLGPDALENGIDVGISSWRRMAQDTFPAQAKIGGQYVNSQFILQEALAHGYAEGIALDMNGYVSEGSGENIFIVYQGELWTPPISASILLGVTRRAVIQIARDLNYRVREENIPREMLYIADEIFFTGTAAEITPVRSVDHIAIGTGKRGPVTMRLQEHFFNLVEGRMADPYGWLTPVQ